MTGEAGDRIILQCQVDSNPPPQYRWIKDGDIFEVKSSLIEKIILYVFLENVLIIIFFPMVDELICVILDCGHGTRVELQPELRI